MFEVKNKDTRTTSRCAVLIANFEQTKPFSNVYFVDFEQITVCCGVSKDLIEVSMIFTKSFKDSKS